ncbi:hypothetical protein Srufu_021090 [Streptomyces libani subsp. rufus]|nr:hypothetical protein Srufu_021090 [Streptomyces libani subsp. rufus]
MGVTGRDLATVALVAAREEREARESDHGDDRRDHRRGPIGAARLGADPFGFVERCGGGRRGPAAVLGVELVDQGSGIEGYGTGERPDVPRA